jgi:predicted RND superfamily exporter protein
VIHRLAEAVYRWRYPLNAAILGGLLLLLPGLNLTDIDNDLGIWISRDDPVFQAYERFREEFGGQRSLIVALESDELFAPGTLAFIRDISDEIERVDTVERVSSLATANVVRTRPSAAGDEDDGTIEVVPVLEEDLEAPGAAARVRARALDDPLIRGDLVSEDGRVTAIVVTFDEDRIDSVRKGVIEGIHALVDARLPAGTRAYYNGGLEINETYNNVTLANARNLTPPVALLTMFSIYFLFRSWRLTVLVSGALLVAAGWTLGLYTAMGLPLNILTSMLPPMVLVLAVADDVHIVQHFGHELAASRDPRQAFVSTFEHLVLPLLAASGTTALGMFSLATSEVVAVRAFGIGAGVGVMVDFAMSLVLVPTLLTFLRPEEMAEPPQERWLVGPMRWVARLATRRAGAVAAVTVGAMVVAAAGIQWLRVDTNHINFFRESHPLHQSAVVIDRDLSGVYSFNILLEGEPDSMKAPETLRRMEALKAELQQLPFVKKVVTLGDYVARVNRELNGGDPAAAVVPASAEAIAQELFVFGLSDDGRRELDRVVASDYSRSQISVKLASMSSDLVFESIDRADVAAQAVFAGSDIAATTTGFGRVFATLDHYIVTSQLSSFLTAFVTVFAVIFVVFRSVRFGVLAIIANALPVVAVLGIMGWLGLSLNVATIMVASVALGIVDDDTIHFLSRFRLEAAAGRSTEEAIEIATVHEGRASLTTAIVNSLCYSVMAFSAYRPSAWFGGLLATTMIVALLAEVLVTPAVIILFRGVFGADRFPRRERAA